MTTKHTPGPWVVQEVAFPFKAFEIVTAPNGEKGWPNYRGISTTPNREPFDKANARLIAAAPELLAALKAVSRLDYLNEHNAIAEQVSKVIAKAEGTCKP